MSSEFFFQSNVASSTFHDPTFFDRINSDSVQGAADELRAVGTMGGGHLHLSHILVELEEKHVPSKNLSLLITPPDLQTFRRLWSSMAG